MAKSDRLHEAIRQYLISCRELNSFCSQNGWIENESLVFEVQAIEERSAVVAVRFTEVIMEGSGCVADRIACFGKLRLFFDEAGKVTAAESA